LAGMPRVLPPLLIFVALLADASGSHGLALALVFVAIPAAFALALGWYGDSLEARCSLLRPILAGLALALLVLSAALRSPAVVGGVPALAISALVGSLVLYGAVALGALLPGSRTVPESA
jgi:hypothetical protein